MSDKPQDGTKMKPSKGALVFQAYKNVDLGKRPPRSPEKRELLIRQGYDPDKPYACWEGPLDKK